MMNNKQLGSQQLNGKRVVRWGLALALCLLVFSPAAAASIVVDGTVCTLPDAITAANTDTESGGCLAGGGADTLILGGNVQLTGALPDISSTITIEGQGYTINGAIDGGNFSVLKVTSTGNLTLSNLSVTGGTVTGSGGGVHASGVLVITHSTIHGNSATNAGGGVYVNSGGSATLVNSTLSGNSAALRGGGIDNYHGTLILTNCTLTSNSASGVTSSGGGLYLDTGTTTINHTLVSGNTSNLSGRELYVNGGTVNANNYNLFAYSGISTAQAFSNFSPGLSDWNAASDGSHPQALSSLLNSTLATNGGPAKTHALPFGSYAIDRAPSTSCSNAPINGIDQRGGARNFDGNGSPSSNECDVGAVEYRAPQIHSSISAGQTYTYGSASIYVTTLGTLHSLQVEEMNASHLLATGVEGGSGIKTGNWWHVLALDSSQQPSSGYVTNLTLTHSNVNSPKVCKWPGNLGGSGWDCAISTADSSTATRNGIGLFSDWAVGTNVGPTALQLAFLQTREEELAEEIGCVLASFLMACWMIRHRYIRRFRS